MGGSLGGPPGVAYDPDAGAISGTLSLTAGEQATLTFAVRVGLTGSAAFAPTIVNRACVYPPGGGLADCEWSDEVWTFTYARRVYLPLVRR